jgi:hypothetical protein
MAGRAVRTCSLDHFANRICNAFDGIWRAHEDAPGESRGFKIGSRFLSDKTTERRVVYRGAAGATEKLAVVVSPWRTTIWRLSG